jgi:DNA-directed RNA polymerase subunit RPC12/RpoP
MKIACKCGEIIRDQTDNLPWKGHLIPDQQWDPVLEAIDRIIDETKSGLLQGEAPYMHLREVVGAAAKPVYQCGRCGRIFIFERQEPAHIYWPESESTSKEILRTRQEND